MSRLLYIKASPRGKRSISLAVGDAFVEAYKVNHSEDEVDTIDVFKAALPRFDGLAVLAKYTILYGKSHTKRESQAWKEVEAVIERFKSADKYVLSTAMWNFNIPYKLKQYIDILVQPGYTFSYSPEAGYQGLVKGKPMTAIYARGGEYKSGTADEAFDMQKKYIELIFGFMGFENIKSIIIEPTLMSGPEVADAKVQEAIEKAKQQAGDF